MILLVKCVASAFAPGANVRSAESRVIGRGREQDYHAAGNFCSLYGWAHLIIDLGSVDLTHTHG